MIFQSKWCKKSITYKNWYKIFDPNKDVKGKKRNPTPYTIVKTQYQGRVHGGVGGGTPPPFKFRGGYYPPPRHSQLILLQSKRH